MIENKITISTILTKQNYSRNKYLAKQVCVHIVIFVRQFREWEMDMSMALNNEEYHQLVMSVNIYDYRQYRT